jgi:hypothetical protein
VHLRCSRRAFVLSLALAGGCFSGLELRTAPTQPFDAVIVPGCPSEDDGSLSLCQVERVVWAALVWERGYTRTFIVSGAAVHSPYVEAEALAAGMAALGVPPEIIYLEPNALHTDENMYDSMQIARALGFRSIAVASSRGHATTGCRMLLDWRQPCSALSSERAAVILRHRREHAKLDRVRTRRDAGYLPILVRERRIAQATGRPPRPPSYLLYPWLGWLRLNGEVWLPNAPKTPPRITWAAVLAERSGPQSTDAERVQ